MKKGQEWKNTECCLYLTHPCLKIEVSGDVPGGCKMSCIGNCRGSEAAHCLKGSDGTREVSTGHSPFTGSLMAASQSSIPPLQMSLPTNK